MNDIFTLQVNDSGAWRNVVKGTKEQMQDIEQPVINLARIAGARYKWRIIHAALGDVIGYCHAPDFVWAPPNHSRPPQRLPCSSPYQGRSRGGAGSTP